MRPELKDRWLKAIPICLTLLLLFVLFAPVVQTPGGHYTSCNLENCVDVVQYGSISYTYAGVGAIFQTGVNWYSWESLTCNCPNNVTSCCALPYGGIVSGAILLLLLADCLSVFMVARRGNRGRRQAL